MKIVEVYILSIAFVLISFTATANDGQKKFGEFTGKPKLTFEQSGGVAELNSDFSFTDSEGKVWTAKSGKGYDGASIPRPLWTLIGAPFTGPYLYSSVIHDFYCFEDNQHLEKSVDVHRMFYNGLRASGVGKFRALYLYYGVLIGGPDWEIEQDGLFGPKKVNFISGITQSQVDQFELEMKQLEAKKDQELTIEDIEKLSEDARLRIVIDSGGGHD